MPRADCRVAAPTGGKTRISPPHDLDRPATPGRGSSPGLDRATRSVPCSESGLAPRAAQDPSGHRFLQRDPTATRPASGHRLDVAPPLSCISAAGRAAREGVRARSRGAHAGPPAPRARPPRRAAGHVDVDARRRRRAHGRPRRSRAARSDIERALARAAARTCTCSSAWTASSLATRDTSAPAAPPTRRHSQTDSGVRCDPRGRRSVGPDAARTSLPASRILPGLAARLVREAPRARRDVVAVAAKRRSVTMRSGCGRRLVLRRPHGPCGARVNRRRRRLSPTPVVVEELLVRLVARRAAASGRMAVEQA
jgi:hypothetical protein